MLPKWNLNAFAEYVVFMLKEHGAEYAQSLHQVRRDRLDMASQLAQLPGLTVYPAGELPLRAACPWAPKAPWSPGPDAPPSTGILVRECGNKIGSSSRFRRLVVRPQVDVRRLVSGLEQVLYGTRRGAAVPELAQGTSYSSGTAAVDRLVGQTNGAGMQDLAAMAVGGGAGWAGSACRCPCRWRRLSGADDGRCGLGAVGRDGHGGHGGHADGDGGGSPPIPRLRLRPRCPCSGSHGSGPSSGPDAVRRAERSHPAGVPGPWRAHGRAGPGHDRTGGGSTAGVVHGTRHRVAQRAELAERGRDGPGRLEPASSRCRPA